MESFVSLLKTAMICGTILFIATLVLLALPKSRLRSIGLEMTKWVMATALSLLVVSPIDLMPDVVPVIGWADDVGYVVGAIAAVRSAMSERRQRALIYGDE